MNGTRQLAAAIPLLTAIAIAGCGSSSHVNASAGAPAGSAPSPATPAAQTQPAAAPAVTVTVKHSKLGQIVAAGSKHLTVYLLTSDKPGASSCAGACAGVWPPVTGPATAGPGAHASALGTITRTDGTLQVTYHGHPLYYFAKDKDDGDAYGQGAKAFGGEWYVLTPAGGKLDKS